MALMQVRRYFTNCIKGRLLLLFLAIVSIGCSNEKEIIIHYKFNNYEVSRYDDNKKSYFFYGNCKSVKNLISNAAVIVDWQFDDFLQASLIFHEDGTIEIMNDGGGEFKLMKNLDRIFFKEYESPEYNRIKQKYLPPNRFHNFCRLSDNLEFETKTNNKFGSDVLVEYVSK